MLHDAENSYHTSKVVDRMKIKHRNDIRYSVFQPVFKFTDTTFIKQAFYGSNKFFSSS